MYMSESTVGSRMQRHDMHKLHGLGNDFLVWFRSEVPANAAQLARRWCDRSTGLGADGLIVAIDQRKAPQFVLFNSDGSRAEVSGNGLRCFAHAIAAHRGLDELVLKAATDAGPRGVSVTGALTETASASVDMGAPRPGPAVEAGDVLAVIDALTIDTVDIGNPHIVIEVTDPDAYDIATVGPAIEAHFMPMGINVHLTAATEEGLRMSIWERGSGATAACGSGACAAAAVAQRSRPDRATFCIDMPGGSATVEVGNHLVLTGPSTYVAAIEPADPT